MSDNENGELFSELISSVKPAINTKDIQYYLAYDEQGNILNIKDADKGSKYYCPACKGEFILKKSGNTGKGSRRPHFAHKNPYSGFSHEGHLETYLHNAFKTLAFQIIRDRIINNQPLQIQWLCLHCKQTHALNIIPLLSNVMLECTLSDKTNPNLTRRPDIALFGKNGQCIAVIEIIVSHDIEEAAIQFYKQHKVPVIRIVLLSETQLENISTLLENPTTFDACIQPPVQRVYSVPQYIPVMPHYRPSNGVPRDFMDNPNKYGQRKDGSFYRKGTGRKGRKR